MSTKTLLLFFLFMGSYLFAQPAQPLYWSEIKKVMSSSTDINELVEKVKSLNKGFEVTGAISDKGTKFSNGRFQFTLSSSDALVIYDETIDKYGIIRKPDLLTEVKVEGLKEDLGSRPSEISMSKWPWTFLQKEGKQKGKSNVRIIYNKK
ncbi:MAG: hypothetical protein J0L60_06820 [Ignavibacteria bacterium]|nr:hypothetical protein [Ignavibacteria bacterium]